LPFTTACRQFQRERSRVRPPTRAPLADEKAAAAIPSISTMKLKTVYGSVRLAAEMRSA